MLPESLQRTDRRVSLLALLACASLFTAAGAQQSAPPPPAPAAPAAPAPRALPLPDELEPAVNTAPPSAAPSAPGEAPSASADGPAAADGSGSSASRSKAEQDGTAHREPPAPRNSAAHGPTAPKGPARLELETTNITGNRELPKVLYIVPWKRSDLGDLVGKPVNSLLDEVLQPLDRDVFRRENRYYDALKPDSAPGTGAARAAGANR